MKCNFSFILPLPFCSEFCFVFYQELADEVTFYDAVENPEDLNEFEDELITNAKKSTDPRLKRFERKIVMICRKKAAIRNKKVSFNS